MDIKKIDFSIILGAAVPGAVLLTPWVGIFVCNQDCFTLSLAGALLFAGGVFAVIFLLTAALLFLLRKFPWKEWVWALFIGFSCAALVQYYCGSVIFKKESLAGGTFEDIVLLNGICLIFLFLPVVLALWLRRGCFQMRLKLSAVLILTQLFYLGYSWFFAPSPGSGYDFKDYTFSEKEKFSFGSKENIIVLVVDSMGEEIFKETLKKYPGTREIFRDFTCFDRMASPLPKTMYAVPAMLTGIDFPTADDGGPSDEDHARYLNEACRADSSLLKLAKAKGFRIEGYPFFLQTICYAPDVIDNSQHITPEVKRESVEKITELLIDRFIPVPFQKLFGAHEGHIPFVVPQSAGLENEGNYDQIFFQQLRREFRVGTEEKVFKYLHLQGAHDPVSVDEKLESKGGVSRIQQFRGSLMAVELLLQKLKEHGIYDSSTIVITGDHTEKYTPEVVTLIKRPWDKTGELRFNAVPCKISQIAGTVARIGGLHSGSPSLFDLPGVPGSLEDVRGGGDAFAAMTPWEKMSGPGMVTDEIESVQGYVTLSDGRIMVDLKPECTLYNAEKAAVIAENVATSEKYISHLVKGKQFRDLLLPKLSLPEGDYLISVIEHTNNEELGVQRLRRIIPPWYHVSSSGVSMRSAAPDLFHLELQLNRKMEFHQFAVFPGVKIFPECAVQWNGVHITPGGSFKIRLPSSRKNCKVQFRFRNAFSHEGKVSVKVNGEERGKLIAGGQFLNEFFFTVYIAPEEKRVVEFKLEFSTAKKLQQQVQKIAIFRLTSLTVAGTP